jgi:hypothetical protein
LIPQGVEKTESKFKFHAGKTISFDTKGVEKTESISCISCTLLYLSSSVFVFLLKCPTTPLVSSLRKVCKAWFLSGTDKIYTPRTRKIMSQDIIISFDTGGVEKTVSKSLHFKH